MIKNSFFKTKKALSSLAAICTAGIIALSFASTAFAADSLPEKFDPRPSYTSQIRDQYWGTCWAQSGISTLESNLIKTGIMDKDFQLSVEDVLWHSREGWNLRSRNDGGYPAMIVGYLQTYGARSEEDIPYLGEPDPADTETTEFYETGLNVLPQKYGTAPYIYEVTDIAYFNRNATIDEIKSAIYNYGAVNTNYFDGERALYFNPATAGYYCNSELGANHAVSVVGWDDNYSKDNFAIIPPNDGAWIIKNSYGTGFGEDGFIYISYYDANIFKQEEGDMLSFDYYIKSARAKSDRKTYLTDQFGAVNILNYPTDNVKTWANVFDFAPNEKITELSFVSLTKGGNYKLYYASVSDDGIDANADNWTLLSEGVIDFAGFKTVSSNSDFELPEGKGAIVLSIEGNNPSVGTDESLLEGMRPLFNSIKDEKTAYVLNGASFEEVTVEREGVVGTYTEYPDLCIRAYTMPTDKEEQSNEANDVNTYDSSKPLLYVTLELSAGLGIVALIAYKKKSANN